MRNVDFIYLLKITNSIGYRNIYNIKFTTSIQLTILRFEFKSNSVFVKQF